MVCLDRPRSAGGMPRSLHATDRRGDRPSTFRRRDESWFFPRWENSRSSASNRRRSALRSGHGDGEGRHRGCSLPQSGSGDPHFALGSLHPDLAPATRESPSASAPYLQRLNAPQGYFIRAEWAAEPHRGLLFDNGLNRWAVNCLEKSEKRGVPAAINARKTLGEVEFTTRTEPIPMVFWFWTRPAINATPCRRWRLTWASRLRRGDGPTHRAGQDLASPAGSSSRSQRPGGTRPALAGTAGSAVATARQVDNRWGDHTAATAPLASIPVPSARDVKAPAHRA